MDSRGKLQGARPTTGPDMVRGHRLPFQAMDWNQVNLMIADGVLADKETGAYRIDP